MPPPSEPARAGASTPAPGRRRTRLVLAGAVALAVAVAFIYTGLHPVRLMAQARRIGPAPDALLSSYTPPPPDTCRWCGTPRPGSSTSAAGEGFPYEATLPDGRRIALVLNALALAATNDGNSTAVDSDPGSAGGVLYITSRDAPEEMFPKIGTFPRGMDALIGITSDRIVYGAGVHSVTWDTSPTKPANYEQARCLIHLFRVGVLDNNAGVENLTTPAPRNGVVTEIAISPQGNRLLWTIQFTRSPYPMVRWLASYLKPLGQYAEPHWATSIWISGLHGENPTRIGEETELMQTGESKPVVTSSDKSLSSPRPVLPEHFSWVPDGRAIRFVYLDTLYTVPVAGL